MGGATSPPASSLSLTIYAKAGNTSDKTARCWTKRCAQPELTGAGALSPEHKARVIQSEGLYRLSFAARAVVMAGDYGDTAGQSVEAVQGLPSCVPVEIGE